MDFPLPNFTALIPVQLSLSSVLRFILVLGISSLVISLLARLIFGRRSPLNHAISSAMGILAIYVVTVAIYTFQPGGLSRFLSPLPFVQFSGSNLYLLSFHDAGIPKLCENILSLIILAFLVNVIDSLIPKGKTTFRWYVLRFISVILAMALHYLLNLAIHTFLPGVLVTYAPIILLGVLVVMFLLGFVNLILSLLLIAVSPVLGAIYTFFFSNILGKQLSKALLTSAIICACFYTLAHFGFGVICISAAALIAYLPLLIVLLLLWYLIGYLL